MGFHEESDPLEVVHGFQLVRGASQSGNPTVDFILTRCISFEVAHLCVSQPAA